MFLGCFFFHSQAISNLHVFLSDLIQTAEIDMFWKCSMEKIDPPEIFRIEQQHYASDLRRFVSSDLG